MGAVDGDTNFATVQPSRAVSAAARRLSRAWTVSFACAVILPLGTLGLAAVFLVWGEHLRWYALLAASLTVGLAYNVTRFVPRRYEVDESTIPLSPGDAERFARWMATVAPNWRPEVRLTPAATIRVHHGTLTIGVPFIVCLRRGELAALVADGYAFAVLDAHPATRRARSISTGNLGGALRYRTGKASRTSRRLLQRIDAAAERFNETTYEWVDEQRERRGAVWPPTAQVAEGVTEAWFHVCQQWLEPALAERVWHAEPFTGLRTFLDACEQSDLVSFDGRPDDGSAVSLLDEMWRYEADLAAMLVDGYDVTGEPIQWDEHPSFVSVPRWRNTFAVALVAADRATGETRPATLDSWLTLLETGWTETLVAILTPVRPEEPDDPPPAQGILEEVLTAGVSVALLDSGQARAIWEWPYGTRLVGEHGHDYAVGAVVLEALADFEATQGFDRLRSWLAAHGADEGEAVWLGEGVAPAREHSVMAFNGYRGLRTLEAVLSTHALRLFPVSHATGTKSDIGMMRDGTAFQERMAAVNDGVFEGQAEAVAYADVSTATFSPMIGGHWWRLKLQTSDGSTTSIRGNGAGHDIEEELVAQLGDRLQAPWSHRPGWLRAVRNLIGLAGLGFGCFALLMAPITLIAPQEGTRSDAVIFLAIGAALLAIGYLPDMLTYAWDRVATSKRAGRQLPHL